MILNQLQRSASKKEKRARVGRGGKRGTTSGRGTKGQRSRSGHRIRPAIRDYIQRLPKLRGYKNKPKSDEATVITLRDLARLPHGEITAQTLVATGLIPHATARVKILATGRLSKAISVKGLPISAGAKKKIEAAKGTVA